MNLLLLTIEDNDIVSIGNDCLLQKDLSYLLHWLLDNRIHDFYVSAQKEDTQKILEHLGINLLLKDEMRNNPIFCFLEE